MGELELLFAKALTAGITVFKWGAVLTGLVSIAKQYYAGDYYGAIRTALLSLAGLAVVLCYPKIVDAVSMALM